MTGTEIRKKFLKYFKSQKHTVMPGSPLVPDGDPSLLFTNAGMVQFKKIFTGEEKWDIKRATTSQKCMRAGGKHNDFENVGMTARHHTFFEMLGNFSFGDYFKKDAISFAWELMIGHLNLLSQRLWITVFKDDDEALHLWKKVGVRAEKIIRMGEKDNFWSMGETGPCGPCSEIIVDQGEGVGCGKPTCAVGCECDRFLELWNLVFMQYDRSPDGKLNPLPKPSIDTGMGLERMTAVLQGVKSNYESDLFTGIINTLEDLSGKRYGKSEVSDIAIRVIADHIRSMVFLIADGVVPSNEGRGYVLRRIIRRASRYGRYLEIAPPFLINLIPSVEAALSDQYPEISKRREVIASSINSEEDKFSETLGKGVHIFLEEIKGLKTKEIPGELAFKLYDTYGFPLDITEDMAREKGFAFDKQGFERALEEQRLRSRQAQKQDNDTLVSVYGEILERGFSVEFLGYQQVEAAAKILYILKDGSLQKICRKGEDVQIITNVTPFYGESGGQAGDTGYITGRGFSAEVVDTIRPQINLFVHLCRVTEGEASTGDLVMLTIDALRRSKIACNHTATHLLHASLRRVLGDHVKQSGSRVGPEVLRFDYSHYNLPSREDITEIENIINSKIRQNLVVNTQVLPYSEALRTGAVALFEEKYGDKVRMIKIGDFSKELCGGTHVKMTGDIGVFKITSEDGISAGVRRIQAVTGISAIDYTRKIENTLRRISTMLQSSDEDVVERLQKLYEKIKFLEKEMDSLKARLAKQAASGIAEAVDINGVKVVVSVVDGLDEQSLLQMGDRLKGSVKSGLIMIVSTVGPSISILSMVTEDLKDKFNAGEWVRTVAQVLGGKGGGKQTMARGSALKSDKIDDAVKEAYKWVQERMK